MEKVSLTKRDLLNLKELFIENYLILKQIGDNERNTIDTNTRIFLKEIRNAHQDNLLTIMKLIDEKERIL